VINLHEASVHDVARPRTRGSRQAASRVSSLGHDGPLTEERGVLTAAQTRVLELVALGLSSKEMGCRLWVSHQIVTFHIRNLLGKLDATTRTGLVARAYAVGLLEAGCWPPRTSPTAADDNRT
jgi:DNA-binding CsgD family transcriptional regulator